MTIEYNFKPYSDASFRTISESECWPDTLGERLYMENASHGSVFDILDKLSEFSRLEREKVRWLIIKPLFQISELEFLDLLPRIERLEIVSNSCKSVSTLPKLGSLHTVHIAVNNPNCTLQPLTKVKKLRTLLVHQYDDSASTIGGCNQLKNLHICRWKASDVDALRKLKLDHFRLDGTRISNLEGLSSSRLQTCFLNTCPKLESLSGLNVDYLRIWTCNKMRWDDLVVKSLRHLYLSNIKNLNSLEFIRNCAKLQSVIIDGKVPKCDFSPITESQSLKAVNICKAKSNLLGLLSKENPRILFRDFHTDPIQEEREKQKWEKLTDGVYSKKVVL